MVQYLFDGEEHEIVHLKPHGNSESLLPYRRLFSGTQELMINSEGQPKKGLHKIYSSVCDAVHARSIGKQSRGPQDLYSARYQVPKRHKLKRNHKTESVIQLDELWVLLEKAKRDEIGEGQVPFIRECRVHPDFLTVLAHDQQLVELKLFCTNPVEFCVFAIDPKFNIFKEKISLTVTTYIYLKLVHKEMAKPPVFIGPILMHQSKDWKTYSKSADSLTLKRPSLEAILACGSDGEKPLIDGFKRNFPWAIMLRCSIHMKKNIEETLNDKKYTPFVKQEFLRDIFGYQDGETKYDAGLMGSASEENYDKKIVKTEA